MHFLSRKIFFRENRFRQLFKDLKLYICAKNQKNLMNQTPGNPEKPHFLPVFCPNWPPKNFLSKIGLRHILAIPILHLCTKNQKIPMSQSREKLVTDGRTDEHRLIYRTSR